MGGASWISPLGFTRAPLVRAVHELARDSSAENFRSRRKSLSRLFFSRFSRKGRERNERNL